MNTQVHLSLLFLTIHWDEGNRCVWMEWKRFVKGADFRDGLDRGLDLLKYKAAHRWLADLQYLAALEVDDKEWSVGDWFPRAVAAGLKRMAIVRPVKAIPKMSVDYVMRKADLRGLDVAYFTDIDDARAWLRRSSRANPPADSRDRP